MPLIFAIGVCLKICPAALSYRGEVSIFSHWNIKIGKYWEMHGGDGLQVVQIAQINICSFLGSGRVPASVQEIHQSKPK